MFDARFTSPFFLHLINVSRRFLARFLAFFAGIEACSSADYASKVGAVVKLNESSSQMALTLENRTGDKAYLFEESKTVAYEGVDKFVRVEHVGFGKHTHDVIIWEARTRVAWVRCWGNRENGGLPYTRSFTGSKGVYYIYLQPYLATCSDVKP